MTKFAASSLFIPAIIWLLLRNIRPCDDEFRKEPDVDTRFRNCPGSLWGVIKVAAVLQTILRHDADAPDVPYFGFYHTHFDHIFVPA
jgi:hypothetical protein